MTTTPKSLSQPLDYQSAGVNIDAGNRLVDNIKPLAARTKRPEVLGGLGGFGALVEIPAGYRQPVLVSGTDGVGTKLRLAMQMGKHDTIGIDLVAMCVNDIVVSGAEPLFFLDYYATGHLEVDTATAVVTGIAKGCELAGAALVGGETAEMPSMYEGEDYDLAGFCVGVVEKSAIIDGSQVNMGDTLIALASSGAHSNGYSLIRKVLEVSGAALNSPFAGRTLGEVLLEPTRIYVKSILALMKAVNVKALSHITGGGLLENIPRVLPENCCAQLQGSSWQMPEVFQWLQQQGQIADREMWRTFNCGVGMVICVAPEQAAAALACLQAQGETAWLIGQIVEKTGEAVEIV